MNRREWLHNASLAAAGWVAADQLELLERLTWKRSLWPGQTWVHPDGGVIQFFSGPVNEPGVLLAEISVPEWSKWTTAKAEVRAAGVIRRVEGRAQDGIGRFTSEFGGEGHYVIPGQVVKVDGIVAGGLALD